MEDQRRILVVANRTCPCPALHDEVAVRGGERAEVLVVAPALNKRLAHWVSDSDEAVAAAHERLETAVDELARRGLEARGAVGDADPYRAIEDALVRFEADEIVISTHPPHASNWLEKNLPEKAREQFGVPVTHVVSAYGVEATTSAATASEK